MLPITLMWDYWPELWPKEWTRLFQQLWLVLLGRVTATSSSVGIVDSQFFLHAVESPLTSISLNLELALANLPTNPTLTKRNISHALGNLKHLHNLFQLLQTETNRKQKAFIALSALQEVLYRYHQPQRQRLVSSALQIDADTQIKGNIFYFQEALACLINNAFEAYPHRRNNKHVLVAAYTSKNRLIIYLGDVAEGMHWFYRQVAFIKGFSSKKQGTGLGLAFAKQVIEKHMKGELTLASFPQTGTIFVVSLPLKP